MSKGRALVGTREGYRPCPICRHMIMRHADRGAGACLQLITTYWRDQHNRTHSSNARCECTGPTIENED